MALALFDLDKTLLNGDCEEKWWAYLSSLGLVEKDAFKNYREQFKGLPLKEIDIYKYSSFIVENLARFDENELQILRNEFINHHIAPFIYHKAHVLIEQHKAQKDYLIIITATNSFLTEPVAALLRVNQLIATVPEKISNRFTGKILGVPSFKEGKLIRVNEFLLKHPDLSLKGSYFYSDSHHDVPLLEKVSHPVATNANDKLAKIANARGWNTLNLADK